MPCFSPLKMYRGAEVNSATGKRPLVAASSRALIEGDFLQVPCGQCRGCRIDRSRAWAVRCAHEAQMHADNVFLTLTYDDDHVPASYSVSVREWQLFMMRVRKRLGAGIRFFGCGEYGERLGRPHYHALLFNCDFADKRPWAKRNGYPTYRSQLLGELWPFGNHEIGTVTAQSAAYCARYTLKKMTGDRADEHYRRVSPVDGREYFVSPEFATMSRRPGLGSAWLDKFKGDAFPSDFLIVDGRKVKPPPFYLRKLAEAEAKPIKRARKRHAVQPAVRANSTPARLRVRAEVLEARLSRLRRDVD